MFIGNVEIKGKAALAPMAGVADMAFRELCVSYGAAYVVSEMVSSKGISYDSYKSKELMQLSEKERPAGVQLFGSEPDTMAKAAAAAMEYSPDIIDINMGCPAPKISGNGCGSALMKNPSLCGKLVEAVKKTVNVPVTVKIRKGWDKNTITALEVAKICESAGADAITIHGRTREQQYMPNTVDWDIIKAVKETVKIPVIGNGDITNPKNASDMMEYTGCDMVMIGRGALGNPWIFYQINSWLEHGADSFVPEKSERIKVMLHHTQKICEYKGEKVGMREARKHIAWYFKGFKGAASLRNESGKLETFDQLIELCKKIDLYS